MWRRNRRLLLRRWPVMARPDPRVAKILAQHSAASLSLTGRMVSFIRRLFAAMTADGWYSESDVGDLAARLASASRTAQSAQGNATARYLDMVAREFDVPATGRVTLPENLREGVTPQEVWQRPAVQYRYAVSQGASEAEALKVATRRAVNLADDDQQLADRWTAREKLLGMPSVIGWRRIIRPELSRSGVCGLCVVAADRKYYVEELRAIHENCKCVTMPIFAESDPGQTLNGADLAAIYKAAGSTGAADLKRVRFKVQDHGELGPVLRLQGQNFRDSDDADRARVRTGGADRRPVKVDDAGKPSPERAEVIRANAERTLAGLLSRQSAGESLDGQIAYQRRLIARMGKLARQS